MQHSPFISGKPDEFLGDENEGNVIIQGSV